MTIPAVLYMSLRTGLLVERPSHEGWTRGDVQQWEADHERFAGTDEVDAAIDEAIEEAGKELRAEITNLNHALRMTTKNHTNLVSQVDQLMRENESLRQQVPRPFSAKPKDPLADIRDTYFGIERAKRPEWF